MNSYQYNNSGTNSYYVRPRLFQGALRTIIIANVAVFLVMILFRLEGLFAMAFGLVPKWIWSHGYIWQLFTYMFVHGGFGHIFWNMFILWMFGMEIENYWGRKEFLKYFFITGVGSGLITMLFNLNSTIPVVGASGAIYGVLLAFGMLFPERYIYFYFLIPVKAKYFVAIMGAITFFSTLSPGASNISHLTHLGGLLIGFLYLKRYSIRRSLNIRIPHLKFKNPLKGIIRKVDKNQNAKTNYDTDETLQEEIDRILDKINQGGYDSLSPEEKQTLYLASEYFAKKRKKK